MRYFIFLVFFSLFSSLGFANKMDSLQSDSDVYRFLITIDSNYRGLNVNAFNIIYSDPAERKIADSLHIKMWQKIDLNNDGQTDILVYGYSNVAKLFLIAYDHGKYDIYDVPINTMPFTVFPIIKKDGDNTYLELNYDNKIKGSAETTIPIQLHNRRFIYKFNVFIEPNTNSFEHTIESITYSSEGCKGECPVFTLSINAKGKAVYESKKYSGEHGKYHATIDSSSFNKIICILNYIGFPKLLDNYNMRSVNQPTCYLTITYDDGKVKKIKDYGEEGTNGLVALYDKLIELRETQVWK